VHHIGTISELLDRADSCEQEIHVLEALLATARECLARSRLKALDEDAASTVIGSPHVAEDRDGRLSVRVVEACKEGSKSYFAAAKPADGEELVRLKLESCGHVVESSGLRLQLRAGQSPHVVWNETVSMPLSAEVMRREGDVLNVTLISEHGSCLDTHKEPLAQLSNQKVLHRWCECPNGWRVHLSLQWVFSRSHLIQTHVVEFEGRLRSVREDLLACHRQLEQLVPASVWNG